MLVSAPIILACDSYEWNGETYNESGTYEYSNIENDNNYSLNFDGDDYVIFPADYSKKETFFLFHKINLLMEVVLIIIF